MPCLLQSSFRYTITSVHKCDRLAARQRWCSTQFAEQQTEAQRGLACGHRIVHWYRREPNEVNRNGMWAQPGEHTAEVSGHLSVGRQGVRSSRPQAATQARIKCAGVFVCRAPSRTHTTSEADVLARGMLLW